VQPFDEINGGRLGGGIFTRPGRDRLEGCRDRYGNCPAPGMPFDPNEQRVDPYRPHHPYNNQGYLRANYDTGRIRGGGR